MSSLGGYIATFCVSLAVGYVLQFLRPKVKLKYWVSHSFLYTLHANPQQQQQALPPPAQPPATAAPPSQPAATANLLTHSLTVRNFGREPAKSVEVVHRRRPDYFQFYPSLDYSETTTLGGEHVLRIDSPVGTSIHPLIDGRACILYAVDGGAKVSAVGIQLDVDASSMRGRIFGVSVH
jgi:hypothetical protein